MMRKMRITRNVSFICLVAVALWSGNVAGDTEFEAVDDGFGGCAVRYYKSGCDTESCQQADKDAGCGAVNWNRPNCTLHTFAVESGNPDGCDCVDEKTISSAWDCDWLQN